jgi:flagellar protein FliO/FliZ
VVWEPRPVENGRGTLTISRKRQLIILGLIVLVPALLFSQEAGALNSSEDSTIPGRVDETTLLLDGSNSGGNATAPSVSPFGIWDLLRMIVVLAAVIGVIYGIFYLLKRGSKGKVAQNDAIRLLGSQALPGNRSMYLVEVGSQVFLIGAGGDSVNLISEITDKETVDAVILRGADNSVDGKKSFGELIAGMFKGGSSQSVGFMREQRERLARLRQN